MEAAEYERLKTERDARKARLQAEREQRDRQDLVALDALEREHGDENVKPIYTSAGMVVVRRPTKGEADQFQEAVIAEGKSAQKAQRIRRATEKLARRCLLHPELGAFDEWTERYPGIPANVGAAAAEFADIVLKEEEGKP